MAQTTFPGTHQQRLGTPERTSGGQGVDTYHGWAVCDGSGFGGFVAVGRFEQPLRSTGNRSGRVVLRIGSDRRLDQAEYQQKRTFSSSQISHSTDHFTGRRIDPVLRTISPATRIGPGLSHWWRNHRPGNRIYRLGHVGFGGKFKRRQLDRRAGWTCNRLHNFRGFRIHRTNVPGRIGRTVCGTWSTGRSHVGIPVVQLLSGSSLHGRYRFVANRSTTGTCRTGDSAGNPAGDRGRSLCHRNTQRHSAGRLVPTYRQPIDRLQPATQSLSVQRTARNKNRHPVLDRFSTTRHRRSSQPENPLAISDGCCGREQIAMVCDS
ncbi:UNVERIFIED_CONTAM: hypothetical protein GTU68_020015 [Idotea baltica]|nr:hypothetical protein [Idotea baltica]